MSYPVISLQNIPKHLSPEEIDQSKNVIAAFFECYQLHEAIALLHNGMRSAFGTKSRLNKADTLTLLYLQEQMVRLLEAAQLLIDDPSNFDNGLQLHAADTTNPANTALYYKLHKNTTAWDCFPRHLDLKEYSNPYLVLDKCLGQLDLAGWQQLLKAFFESAAYDGCFTENTPEEDVYYTCRLLFKLLEACHLIKVREPAPDVP